MRPWEQQNNRKEIADKDRIQSMQEVIDTGMTIPNPRTEALYFLIYLSGGRMCELVRKYEYSLEKAGTKLNSKGKKVYLYNKHRTGEILHGMRAKDIELVREDGRPIMLLYLRNEKHRKTHQKIIPIPLDIREVAIIFNSIKEYLSSIPQEDELFPFGYQYAYRLLKPYFNPHWFRHMRATHLVTNYGFSETQLRNTMGWSDSRPADGYVKMNWRDILKGFGIQNKNL